MNRDACMMHRARHYLPIAAAFAIACVPAQALADHAAAATSAPPNGSDAAARRPAAAADVPGLSRTGQRRYRQYLSLPKPRAFAISADGHYGLASGTDPVDASMPADPKLRALESCERAARADCTLYSVDDEIVFSAPAAEPPVATAPAGEAAAPVPEPAATPTEPPPALALPPSAPPVTWVFEVTGERGLNDLYTLTYSQNGSTTTSDWTIQANTGLGLSGGVSVLPLAQGRLRTRATAGFKFTAQSFSNAQVLYYAFPLEIIETFEAGPVRLGAGMYVLLGPTLSGSGAAEGLSKSFDSAPGFTVRGEWVFNRRVGVGLRFLWNRLSVDGQSMGAPAIGAVVSLNGDVGT
jgi:hypothetical protein